MTDKSRSFLQIAIPCLLLCIAGGVILILLYGKLNPASGKYVKFLQKTVTSPPTVTPPPNPSITSTPTPVRYTISFDDFPSELTEGDNATFTWSVNGPTRTIHSTVVYYGNTSTPGILTSKASPEDTGYTHLLKDFYNGNYIIPLKFIGNTRMSTPGTYYARAYTQIDGKNYWSEERTFLVKSLPKYKITMINYPSRLSIGENGTFTWQILGPSLTTEYTAIVCSKESKSGILDETVDVTQTSYAALTKDFISGTYTVPLTFVGNAIISEKGTYFCRAYTYIKGKNIWSDEFSLSVE